MEQRHPQHDAVATAIRAWYSTSAPALGFHVERRQFGLYLRYPPDAGEVTLRDVGPEDVPALLADVRAYYGDTRVEIYIDDRQADATLGPALVQAGCRKGPAMTHLAHVGGVPAVQPRTGVVVEPLTEATLTEFAVTKLRGFANSEDAPEPRQLAAEIAMRRAEMAGDGRFYLARAGGEPAVILGLWDGADRLVFLLATRVPFRQQGIARWLLSQAVASAYADGCRSIVIRTDPADTPIQIYRRLGFTDEVYWRQRYEPANETAGRTS